ncbi:PREDICTED: transmembrane protein 176A isoform X2 [Galeopterus variegatus]|uniref:Transmembrane protein 176A isoform X2 n=1 Tax=Galeopterus variegatus TaxID=482537 RepID=A0ABM0Q771_GALVR|nr:PREDICTED: transmembrane protein 176A isoform X2 [Galeopterus variegatus]
MLQTHRRKSSPDSSQTSPGGPRGRHRGAALNVRWAPATSEPLGTACSLPRPPCCRRMSMDMGMVDGGKVAPEAPQPTRIDVHIHQESAVAKLLLAGCSLLWPPAPATATNTKTPGSSRLLVASRVVQIVLGVLSGVLGGFLYIVHSHILFSGAAIWTGAVAVLAGAAAFIYERRGGTCWALLKTLLKLAAFSTAIAAIVIEARDLGPDLFSGDYVCNTSPQRSWATQIPITENPEEVRRLHQCLSYVNMLAALIISLHAMLLGVWILLLLASLAPLFLFCWRKFLHTEERDQKNLLEVSGI